jgi:triosephosphate isomerase
MTDSARRPIVAANWKMHFRRRDAESWCRAVRAGLGRGAAEVVVFPSFPLLVTVGRELAGSPVAWGGQDLHPEADGAHTGDVSGAQLADVGCTWALCGHSERRRDHGESDELVAAKARAAREAALVPLICVGETLEERRAGRTNDVLTRQLAAALAAPLSDFELAYEPVWAIGTGETATPEIAQQAHAHLRGELARLAGAGRAAAVRILYGGSAKPDNAAALAAGADVDGFLVGGASLDSTKFLAIIGACA